MGERVKLVIHLMIKVRKKKRKKKFLGTKMRKKRRWGLFLKNFLDEG